MTRSAVEAYEAYVALNSGLAPGGSMKSERGSRSDRVTAIQSWGGGGVRRMMPPESGSGGLSSAIFRKFSVISASKCLFLRFGAGWSRLRRDKEKPLTTN